MGSDARHLHRSAQTLSFPQAAKQSSRLSPLGPKASQEPARAQTADHGEELGEHHLFSKTGFFDASYRLPLIVRDPRSSADAGRGQTVEAFTEAVVRRTRSLLASRLHSSKSLDQQ